MNPYTIDEWISDFDLQARLSCDPKTRRTGIEQPMRDHFYSRYTDEQNPVGRIARFFEAMKFLDLHMNQILEGQGGVSGGKESLVGKPVVMALYDHFAHLGGENIYKVPTVEEFVETTKKHGA